MPRWSTTPESAQAARQLLDEEGRDCSNVPYELALYGLVRSGATRSHRELAAGFLNIYAQLLDTQSGKPHS